MSSCEYNTEGGMKDEHDNDEISEDRVRALSSLCERVLIFKQTKCLVGSRDVWYVQLIRVRCGQA